MSPGSLVFLGERRVSAPTITMIDYDADGVREAKLASPEACREHLARPTKTWFNVTGLHDADLLGRIGKVFGLHPLVVEDVLNTGQRPKFDDHADYVFFVVKMIYRQAETGEIVAEQVSAIMGANYLLTFQECEGDVFDMLRERIRSGKGRVRRMGCDYLAYALLDAIVDHTFIVLEDIGERIEDLQDSVLRHAEPATLQAIHSLKRELILLRKTLWPLREVVGAMERHVGELHAGELRPFLRDLSEHTFQVIDSLETMRDLLSSALDIYMTSVSNRMNEVMKVLTIMATVFIPLTFVAGVYGMNFEHMPELGWTYAYPVVMGFMALIAAGMLVFFKHRRWI